MKGWAKVKDAAKYFGVSERTLRSWLADASINFPYSKLPSGTILIELSAGDEWLRGFSNEKHLLKVADEILKGVA